MRSLIISLLFLVSSSLYANPASKRLKTCEVKIGNMNGTPRVSHEHFVIGLPKGTEGSSVVEYDRSDFDYISHIRIKNSKNTLKLTLEDVKITASDPKSHMSILSSEAVEGFSDDCDSCATMNSMYNVDALRAIGALTKIKKELAKEHICQVVPVQCFVSSSSITRWPGIRYELRLSDLTSNPLYFYNVKVFTQALNELLDSVCSIY